MLHTYIYNLKRNKLQGLLVLALVFLAAIVQAQTTGYIVKGGPDTGSFSGGVLIGLTSKINYSTSEQRILIDEKPGIIEGSWKDVTGITQSATSLTKTATDGWGNAGAASNSILDTLQNGWIQYKVNNLSDILAFGFSANNVDAHYNSINYAVMINAGQLSVYNQGQLVGSYGAVAVNDSIRIARIGNILFFTKNKGIFYNQEVDGKQPVAGDVALYSQGIVFELKSSFAQPCDTNLNVIATPASQTVCSGQTAIITASGATTYIWSTGASTNSIYVSSSTTTTYTVTGVGNGCTNVAIATITVNPTATANAGLDEIICSNNTSVALNGTVVSATGGVWSTSGSGVFYPNPNMLDAHYNPSIADVTIGAVTLTLTTTGNGSCNAGSDEMVVSFAASSPFGLLASGAISSNDSVFVVGDVGAIGGVSSYIRVSGNILQNNNIQTQQALLNTLTNKNCFSSMGGANIPSQLKGQSLFAGSYLIQGNSVLDSVMNLSGDTSSVFVFNIQGDLTVLKGSVLELNNLKYKNIIWNVSGDVNLQESVNFSGIIISNGNIIYNTENFGKASLFAPNGNISLQNNKLLIPLSLYSPNTLKNLFTQPLIPFDNTDFIKIPFCDSKIAPPLPKNINLPIDRFNNGWISSNDPPTTASTCSGFNLYFEDVIQGTGIGFAAPAGLGTIRQQTACAVFDYIASIIDLNGATPDVVIQASETDGTGPLAVGSPFFASMAPSGFDGGDLYKHITTTVDPAIFPYDGRIKIDFGNRSINGNVVTVFSNYPASSSGQLDLFSIMLHEAMHALGFASFIGYPNGASVLNGPYSIFDKSIKMGNNFLVSTSDTFQGNTPPDLVSDQLFFSKTGSCAPQPVFSINPFQSGSSLSHYDDSRSTYNFVMRPSTSGGDDRILTNPEIRTLCDLGYSVFGTSCTNCAPQGINDFGSTSCGGSQICINAISNDIDSESNPISFDLTFGNNGILILNGGGSASISGNQVCYTPSATFTGTANLQYKPKDALSTGNVTDIYITVSCPYCPDDPCNFIFNGNMEVGWSLAQFDADPDIFNSIAESHPNPTAVTNWWSTNGSADLFIRGSTTQMGSVIAKGIPINIFTNNYLPNGINTHNGIPNNRYIGCKRTAYSPYFEGIFSEITQPLNQTKTYNLDLWVFAADNGNAAGINGMVNILMSNTLPPQSINNINIVAGSGTQSLASNYSFPNSQWHHIIIPNIIPAFANIMYLIIEPVKPTTGSWEQYLFFDDVRLTESAPPITITKSVNNLNPSYNQNITYSMNVCNAGNTTANNVVIQDVLPPGLTAVSGYTAYPDITIGNLNATQCTTVNVVATVTNSIPVNTTITNCAVVLSGGSNCLNNVSALNCVDIKVPATDISILKTVSSPTPCSGSDFSYSVIISNLGNESATNVHVQDLLPSGINYVSHTLNCSGTYNSSTGDLHILALPANTTCTLNVVVNIPAGTSGTFNNCATLNSLDQIELGLGNNSSCAGINVAPFFVNFTTGSNLCIGTTSNPNSIPFTYTGSAATSYSWYFGDNTAFSSLQNPTHSYTSPGTYQISLTVAGAGGCNYTYSKVINISPSCCPFGISYNDNSLPDNITTSTIWTNNLKINKTIIVKAPAILTIAQNITIEFGPFGKIILENGTGVGAIGSGAQLDLKPGSKLTSTDCPAMWQGVEVWGKPANNSSVALGQARITMRQGSTIENAHIGVLLGKSKVCTPSPCTPFDLSYGGGIIDALQANFNKNGTAVEFISYSKNNSSTIQNCSFTGGILKDNGYKTGNTYVYPNSVNPYYAPAINTLGTAPRLAYLWKVKNIRFIDNTFKTADKGIQIYDAKCIIEKGSSSLGNHFTNLNQGISGMYSSTSPFMGNTIKQNTFKNTLLPATGTSPVTGIFLSGSQSDRIEGNIFGDPTFPSSVTQAYHPFGIYLNNSSYFKVLDNKFYKNKIGIYVNKSFNNGGIIQRYTDPQSNFFQRCSTSVQTNLDNNKLKIRCNITNNSIAADYGINWYNHAGKLANQGLPASSLQITRPAGNRFNSANLATACGGSNHRREIKNDYATLYPLPWPLTGTISIPVFYAYYSHNSPVEYIPCNSGGVTVSQTSASCPGFSQCCPTDPCLNPNPPYWCNVPMLAENNQELTSLRAEFNNVSANLDRGQTTLLIAAINQNTADGQLKNMLLNNSLLSDVTLNSFINRTQATAPGTFKEVIIPNSPVSDQVLPSLQAKLQTLPPGIAKQISDAQASSAYRTLTLINREMSAVETELQSAVNNILSSYVDNDSAQAIALLQQQNTADADQSLLGTYIVNENFSEAQSKINSMAAINAEEQDFIDIQNLVLNLEQQGKTVFDLDNQQEQLVRTIAGMPSSLAQVNACAILGLVFNETCAPAAARKLNPYDTPNDLPTNVQSAYLGDNIPNPFNNLSVIPYVLPENTEKAYINIYDLTGKPIKGYEVHSSSNSLIISSQDFLQGFYIYKLETKDVVLGSKKMIVIK